MTEKGAIRLAQRVERWRDRLTLLGLAHWRIDSVSVVSETSSGESANATVTPSHSYNSARFEFTHDFVDAAEDRELDEVIIHEWLHVAMRDYDQAVDTVSYDLSPGTRHQWSDRVTHEREGFIDAMARQIYALWAAGEKATPAALRRHHY